MAGSEPAPTRTPFYGWVVLGVAAAAMVGTLPGRTQGLGLITEPLLAELKIGRVDYAQLNLWATLIGTAGAFGVGRFIDRAGSRVVLALVAAALGAIVCLMSRAASFTELAIAVTLTRALGQSALSVVSIAMVGQWFVRRIDMAMAVYSIVMSIGFMIAFPVVGSIVQSAGWRAAWFGVGATILAALVPLALLLVRRNPESIGLRPDGLEPGTRQPGTRNPEPGTARVHSAGSAGHARVLDLRGRCGVVRARRLGHRPLQRIDPGRARIRSGDLLPDARRHGDYRARGKFRRRLARALHGAERAAGDLAPGARHRTARAAARQLDWDGDGLGDDDGAWRWPRDGAVLQRMAPRLRPPSSGPHPGRRAGHHRGRISCRPAAAGRNVERTGSYAAMFNILAAAVGVFATGAVLVPMPSSPSTRN